MVFIALLSFLMTTESIKSPIYTKNEIKLIEKLANFLLFINERIVRFKKVGKSNHFANFQKTSPTVLKSSCQIWSH